MIDAKSGYKAPPLPEPGEFEGARIAILATRWNVEIVDALIAGAHRCLAQWGVPQEAINEFHAAGAFEVPLAATTLLGSGSYDAVIALGAVIRGDTPHFDFVAGECARGLMDAQLNSGMPVGFGVLTVNNVQQAQARAGAGPDNKGFEAAAAVLEMLRLQRSLR